MLIMNAFAGGKIIFTKETEQYWSTRMLNEISVEGAARNNLLYRLYRQELHSYSAVLASEYTIQYNLQYVWIFDHRDYIYLSFSTGKLLKI
jgi:hypothetical protein